MKFILYGKHNPCTYVNAARATSYRGWDFEFTEMDCESVMIAFDSGGEVGRTYDMNCLVSWVDSMAASVWRPPSGPDPRGALQAPLPGLDTPPCL